MKVAAIQHDIVWEDRDATLRRLGPQIAAAAGAGARLVALPEMFATGFSMRTDIVAEPADGPTVAWLQEYAATYEVWLAGSVALRPDPASDALPTNSLVVVGPDGTQHRYDKRQPFTMAGEAESFRGGDELVTVTIEGVRWSLSICYDLRFADLYWSQAAQTDAYLIVASWPVARRHHWTTLLAARAIENQAYVVGVNRVGTGGSLEYVGDSQIVGPSGEVLASASMGESILVADIDPTVVADLRSAFPFQADRREPIRA